MRHGEGTAPRCATRTAAARTATPSRQRNPQIRNRRQCNIINRFKNHRQSRARDESHADATPTRGRARSATRPRRGGAVPPGPGAGGAVSPERDRIGAGAAASDAGPRPPAQRPPPVPRDAIVRSSMGSLVDRACSGYTKTKKLNEAGERSAPVRVGELPGASPRGAGSPGRSARRVGLGF